MACASDRGRRGIERRDHRLRPPGRMPRTGRPDPGVAFRALQRQTVDLVVRGVGAADQSRRAQVISELRLRTEGPVVVIDDGAESAQLDLEAGADQWLPKSFLPGALVGAIRAALRAATVSAMPLAPRFEIRGMVLEGDRRRLLFGDAEVLFTRQEWDLLAILVNHPNRYLGARQILRLGWRAGEHGSEQLRTYVRRLRLKLDPLGLPCRLLSKHGQGYCLDFDGDGSREHVVELGDTAP